MAENDSNMSLEQRLSQQLHLLSELSETLTMRILEIEERLLIFENEHKNMQNFNIADTADLLMKSEERVRNLQSLLQAENLGDNIEDINEKKEELTLVKDDGQATNNEAINNSDQEVNEFSDSPRQPEENPIMETYYEDDPQMPLISA